MLCSANDVKKIIVGLGLVLFAGVSVPSVVQAASTKVNALVCGVGSQANIVISSPSSDSVVDASPIELTGMVANATQIDITVDGAYNSTLPLDSQQTSFTTPVSLAQGTHTIKLVANDVCNMQNGEATLLITYQPKVIPGAGTDTTTTVNNGIVINSEPVDTSDSPDDIGFFSPSTPIIGPVIGFLDGLARDFDLDKTAQDGIVAGVFRFVFIVVGLILLSLGSLFFIKLGLGLAWFMSGATSASVHIHRRRDLLVRIAGLLLILSAFFI